MLRAVRTRKERERLVRDIMVPILSAQGVSSGFIGQRSRGFEEK
jgi:hypothetical protein